MHEREILLAALEKPRPEEREAYLAQACSTDPALRRRVESLLRASEVQDSFLERPAFETELLNSETDALSQKCMGHDELSLDFLQPTDDPPSLGRLGYYEVLEVLGHGGFGVVLKARDTKLDRIVAVKTLAQSLASSATARKRFVREAKAAAAVKHENVVGIYHVSDEGPVPYLVMECVGGVSLQAKLQQAGTLDLPAILRIGTQVASGLAAAHKQGLVHRDVKPGNILLENGVERVKITDFGLARAADDAAITRTGEVAGTPQYMSPEQAQGLSLDARSDLFSLGSVLYAMGTGRSPFRAESTIAALRRVCDDTPRPIREINRDIPDWLADIINRLLAKQPSDRFQSAAEVAELLGWHLAHVQQSAIVPSPKPTIVSPRHPSAIGARWWTVALIALVAVAGVMGLTEASGVTKVVPTVIRIVRGEGTLVIEVDDPAVQVSLDGEELSIRGAGLKELKLLPGKYRLHATKDGRPVKDEVVTISRDGRKVVTVTRESPGSLASSSSRPLAIAPFSAEQAKMHQDASAQHLSVPVELTNSVGMRLRLIPAGEFRMGSPENEPDREAHEAQRQIKITKPFFLGLHPVTVGQFQSFVSETGYKSEAETGDGALIQLPGNVWRMDPKANWRSPGFEQTDDHPVTCISWNDATSFCNWLSAKEGRRYTLPTEAQWEYACRAGSGSKFFFGDNDQKLAEYAWFSKNSAGKTHPVGQKKPNAWGLYDVHGNVYQWTADWYAANYGDKSPEDPSGPASGKNRVLRGGAWCTNERRTRDAFRNGGYAPSSRANSFGLRVVLIDHLKAASLPGALIPSGAPPTSNAMPAVERPVGELTLLAKLDGHTDVVRAVAFLPDGRRMVSVSNNKLPDVRRLVSVSHDKLTRNWDLPTRTVLSTLPAECYLMKADVSADGRLIAVLLRDDSKAVAQVWDIEKPEVVCHFAPELNQQNFIRFSPDGTRLVTSGITSGVLLPYGVLWDAATGRELGRFDMGDSKGVHRAAFSPDGRLLALGAPGRVRVFDIESRDVVADVPLPKPWNVWDLEFAPSGKTLATGQGGGHVSLIEVGSRRVIKTLQGSFAGQCSLRFLGSDTFLLTCSYDGILRVWDLEQGKVLARAATENGPNYGLFVSPDGRQVITAGGKHWDDVSQSIKEHGDYAPRLWQLPESVWPKVSGPTSLSADTVEQPGTPKDP